MTLAICGAHETKTRGDENPDFKHARYVAKSRSRRRNGTSEERELQWD